MNESREFKGIWIPAEIWLEESLTIEEKVLIAEIHSLSRERKCFATNKYLAEFMGRTEKTIANMLSSFRSSGILEASNYDGSERTLVLSTGYATSRKRDMPLPVGGKSYIEDNKEDNKVASKQAIQWPENLKTEEFKAAWLEWVAHRKQLRKPLTAASVKRQLSKLSEMGPDRATKAILFSILNGWTGIYEEKQLTVSGQRPAAPAVDYAKKYGVNAQ